jgi:hypothetical protein
MWNIRGGRAEELIISPNTNVLRHPLLNSSAASSHGHIATAADLNLLNAVPQLFHISPGRLSAPNNASISTHSESSCRTKLEAQASSQARSGSVTESSIGQNKSSPRPTSLPALLYLEADANILSNYQCFLRKQIEIFESSNDDVQFNASRMNRSIVLGQVGLRCRHCANTPEWERSSGAVYYPGNLSMLYQAGQNLAKNHLCQGCNAIPQQMREYLKYLRAANRRASNGKEYWKKTARYLGIIEDGARLRFQCPSSTT